MRIRRIDIAAWAGLIALAHVLLVSRWVEPFVNVALYVVNLYFLLFGALLAHWRREAGRPVGLYLCGYVLGYAALAALCFVYNLNGMRASSSTRFHISVCFDCRWA